MFVVDDEQIIAQTLAAILRHSGFSAEAFTNPGMPWQLRLKLLPICSFPMSCFPDKLQWAISSANRSGIRVRDMCQKGLPKKDSPPPASLQTPHPITEYTANNTGAQQTKARAHPKPSSSTQYSC
jgi:hypothetical protein